MIWSDLSFPERCIDKGGVAGDPVTSFGFNLLLPLQPGLSVGL